MVRHCVLPSVCGKCRRKVRVYTSQNSVQILTILYESSQYRKISPEKMNPTQQQVTWGNHHYPHVASGVMNNHPLPEGKLWGGTTRRVMGCLQIICGAIECVLGIAAICVPGPYYFDGVDYVSWGIWIGLFAIVAGFLGVFSLRSKCTVIAYMVTSIISVILCVFCLYYAAYGVVWSTYSYHGDPYLVINKVIYIILCIVVFSHAVMSIIGASFTCGALCSTTNQTHQIVYYTPYPMVQQMVPTPPYTAVASDGGTAFQNTPTSVNGANESQKI